MAKPTVRFVTLLLLALLPLVKVSADISQKQARKAIAKAAGMALPSDSVRVEKILSSDATNAEVSSQLELVFRFARDERDQWRIKEVRTGDARWEDVEILAQATRLDLQQDDCNTVDTNGRLKPQAELTIKQARCLVASLFTVTLPSDAVRIQEISGLSLGPQPSAVAVSLIEADFRLTKDSSGWHAIAFRSGRRSWVSLESIPTVLDSVKRARTTEQLNAVAAALEVFRRDRGSYVISDKHSVLIDNLSPHYLARVIRTDAWQRPYRYQGDRDHFTLRSLGPDGRENTADDIVISK